MKFLHDMEKFSNIYRMVNLFRDLQESLPVLFENIIPPAKNAEGIVPEEYLQWFP